MLTEYGQVNHCTIVLIIVLIKRLLAAITAANSLIFYCFSVSLFSVSISQSSSILLKLSGNRNTDVL